GVAGACGFILLWWICSIALGSTRLPSPLEVGSTFFSVLLTAPGLSASWLGSGIAEGLLVTTLRVSLGAVIGLVLGFTFGLVISLFPTIRDLTGYLFEVVRTVPPLAALPFFMIWFGTGQLGQLAIIAFYCAVMIAVNVRVAVINLP